MTDQLERLWTYGEVHPGQQGPQTTVEVTAQDIAEYAAVSQNPDAYYREPGAPAMPTMILSYAPLCRETIANNNGFIAYEESSTQRRQTPFTKCEIRWHNAVVAGDTIRGRRSVLEKYERRGSHFVTFRVEAINQHGILVGDYDYTCIFDHAKVSNTPQRGVQQETTAADPHSGPARPLETISVSESQESINTKDGFRLVGERGIASNIHTDEEFARQSLFGTTVNSGPATMAYVNQLIERSLGAGVLYRDGRLLMRAITPFRVGDTVTFTGRYTTEDNGATTCNVRGTNQHNELVCAANASFHLAGG
ncbi:MAG: MaoC family dehydratase [Gammaproteobacteria bacterium]|nr:MaoC family dehydratase [Gammaproteobacteria bacterium]